MRIIGLDTHRVFAEAITWDDGKPRGWVASTCDGSCSQLIHDCSGGGLEAPLHKDYDRAFCEAPGSACRCSSRSNSA